MEDVIIGISDASQFIIVAAMAVLTLGGNILFFTKLYVLRKKSKRFLESSKKENFKGGLKLFQIVRSLFAFVVFLDVVVLFFSPRGVLKISDAVINAVMVAMFLLQLVFGIPIILHSGKAARLFRNMHPVVPKAEVPERDTAHLPVQKEGDCFFEIAETVNQAAAQKNEPLPDEILFDETFKASEETDEIIEYDDEGYIGAWRLEKSEDTPADGETREEEAIPTKECPFCGTPNNINNKECDFCGADITDVKE